MVAISNTSPIILLDNVGKLTLISELYGRVVIPPAVRRELQAKPDALSAELEGFLVSVDVQAAKNVMLVRSLSTDLGIGEAEAIALATEIPDALLIMDDTEGRRVARSLGLSLTGLLGVLVEAKVRGMIREIKPLLAQMVDAGFWLNDEMLRRVLESVGE